jgi:thiamine-monophosphate kinase
MPFDHFPSSEYRLLDSLKPFFNFRKSRRYPISIGDDAAIRNCRANETLVLTADSFVESVHFSFGYMTAAEVGFKAMAINLSDCAAMGALPDSALVQIIFPKKITKRKFERTILGFYKGFNQACRKWDFPVIGGNLTGGPCWIIDITLVGRAGKGRRLLKRNHAQNNDGLWVTGRPGESGAGLTCLQKWDTVVNIPVQFHHCIEKHIHPAPRIEIGYELSRNPFVHAAIDISDGVSKECHTLSYENNLGIVLAIEDADACVSRSLLKLGGLLRKDWHRWFFFGGEDYELLFAASKNFDPLALTNKYGIPITRIGTFSRSAGGVVVRDSAGTIRPLKKGGWDHLR